MRKARPIGALALTAALAMGAIPAFADTDMSGNAYDASKSALNQFTYEEGNPATNKAGAETKMNVFYNADQILATVPIELTIIATGDVTHSGGIIGPTNYRIENGSTVKDIYVNSFKVTEAGNKWTCDTITGDTSSAANTSKGVLDLKLLPAGDEAKGISFTTAKATATITTDTDSWKATANSSLGMDITGKSLPRSVPMDVAGGTTSTADGAFTLSFVVGLNAAS